MPYSKHLLQDVCKLWITNNTLFQFYLKTTIKTLLFDISTNRILQESSYIRLCNTLAVFTQRRKRPLSRIVKIFSISINTGYMNILALCLKIYTSKRCTNVKNFVDKIKNSSVETLDTLSRQILLWFYGNSWSNYALT